MFPLGPASDAAGGAGAGAGAGAGGGQVGSAGFSRTYPCEMYRPLLIRSHWLVVRTRPQILSPVTLQTSVTRVPLGSLPTSADRVLAAVRTLSEPGAEIVAVAEAASAAVTAPPTNTTVAAVLSTGPRIHRRIVRDMGLLLRGVGVGPFDLPRRRLPLRSVRRCRPVARRIPQARAVRADRVVF